MSVLPEYSGARFPTGVASIYVRGEPEAQEAMAVAAVRVNAWDRSFPYTVGLSHHLDPGDLYPVEIEPDLRLDMTPSLSFTEAEVFIRQIHAAAWAPHVRVTLKTFEEEQKTIRLSGDP